MRFKVLFLPSWYPSKINPINGIFIKRHAEAVSLYNDVAILYVTKDPSLEKSYNIEFSIENNIKTVRVYYKPFRLLNLYRYLKSGYLGLKVVKENFGRPDICHVNVTLFAGIIAFFLNILKGIPYIVTEHSTSYLPEDGTYKGLIKKIITKMIIKKAKLVTVVSNKLKEAMIKNNLKNNFYIIPNVVTISEKKFTTTFSSENNESIKKKKIIHISLLYDKQKNVSSILKVLKNILFQRNDFELHIIGDGVDREKLEKLANDLDLLGKFVFFHGLKTSDEVYQFLSESDFLVTNSNYETFSVATAEALACGIPVIATRCGGPEDFVIEDVGILIEPNNQEQLEKAILYMLDNSTKYDKEKLIEYAKTKFSYDVVGRQFKSVYYIAYYEEKSKLRSIRIGKKDLEYYKNFLIKADNKLHDQVTLEIIKRKSLSNKIKLLDFGCGEGAFSERMKDLGFMVYSSDIDVNSFKASTEYIKINFNDYNEMYEFSKKYKNYFDIVVSIEVIEHLQNVGLYLDTIKHILKPNGLLLLTTPNISSFRSRLYFLYKGIPSQFDVDDLSYGHINPITYLELKTILMERNFCIDTIISGGDLPLLWITTSLKATIFNLFSLLLLPFMKGECKQGWTLIFVAKKASND